jgi:Tat-targeted selenate reductase subunit YnfH
MGNGWHEWPLVLFTVLGQCVAGGLIVTGMGWMAAKTMRPDSSELRGACSFFGC